MNGLCKSCGTPLQGVYCHVCGEKVLMPQDKALKNWLNEVVSNVIQLDGKFIRSFADLVFRPHQMAQNYFEGKRKPYLKAINLFLVANLLYFLLPSFETFKTSLSVQMNLQFYSDYATSQVNDYLLSNEMDLQSFELKYNAKTTEVSKLILIVLAPFLGLFIYMLYSKRIYLTDGFNLALQFWASFILLCVTPFYFLASAIKMWFEETRFYEFFITDAFLTGVMLLFAAVYLWFLLKWLKEKTILKILKILLLVMSFAPIFIIYRGLLFMLTMWSL